MQTGKILGGTGKSNGKPEGKTLTGDFEGKILKGEPGTRNGEPEL